MKRLFSTAVLFLAFVAATYAQQSFKLYRLTTPAYTDAFLKAIDAEIKITKEQNQQISELFRKSQLHQDELFSKPDNTTAERYEAYMTRQQGHLEGNMRIILGEEGYKAYEAAKPKIEATMKAFSETKKN